MSPITFAVFADAHFSSHPAWRDRHYADSLAKLDHAIGIWNQRRLPLVLNLGDLIDSDVDKAAELAALATMRGALGTLRGTCRHVLGNHDVWTMTKEEYLADIRKTTPAASYAFTHARHRFIVLDSNHHEDGSDFGVGNFDWSKAWISAPQLAWLDAELAATRLPVVVVCHGNLDTPPPGEKDDPHLVRNAAAVRALLERHGNVRAVLNGHWHPGHTQIVNGIPYLAFTAMVTGPGLPCASHAIVTLQPDGMIRVEGFGNQASYQIGTAG